jgi:hypothetical protein
MVTKISTSKARAGFADIIEGAQNGRRYLVRSHKRNIAAIVSVEDLAILEAIENRHDIKAARAALEEIERDGSIPWNQVKSELGL